MRTLLLLPLIALTACTPRPISQLDSANALALPSRYDGSQPPIPKIAISLRTVFPSAKLDSLMRRALKNNPDLRASAARLEEAGFTTKQARAGLYPSIALNSGARRAQSNSAGQGFSVGSFVTESFSSSLDAQWEVDVWGRIRAGLTAASANQAAVTADYAAAHQSIAAQTAQAYFELIAATQLMQLTERSHQSFKNTLSLVERRFEAGVVTLGDVSLAQTDVSSTAAQLAQRSDARDQAARRLATLTGYYPSTTQTAQRFPSLKKSIPAGIPSSLLRQRPDLDAAYQRLRAADANVTIAHAELYPSFALTASGGRQSSSLRQLASAQFNVWSLAGNLTAPIFASGALRAEVGAANARSKQAVATYRSTLLNALREVEDALGSEQALAQQEKSAQEALDAARTAEERVRRSYESGLLEVLSLLETQRRSDTSEEALITTRSARYQNRVALALALGRAY